MHTKSGAENYIFNTTQQVPLFLTGFVYQDFMCLLMLMFT